MSAGTGIEWTDATWNPVVGCTKVSAGCKNCYAETMSNRIAGMARADAAAGRNAGKKVHHLHVINVGTGRWSNRVELVPEALTEPLKWKKPRRVFVCSMSDLFHPDVPFGHVDKVLAVAATCPQHTFQILTKRPERMAEYLTSCDWTSRRRAVASAVDRLNGSVEIANAVHEGDRWPLPNVWVGTSCEDQKAADERVPWLLKCPAAVRFLSLEPLLGAIDLRFDRGVITDLMDASGERDPRYVGQYPFKFAPADAITRRLHALHWVIVGGESGHGARACDVAWVRSIVDQCQAAGVAYFVKQLGKRPYTTNFNMQDWPDDVECISDGVHAASGRVKLASSKGGDMAEWPPELRVRQMPGEERRGA